MTQALCYSPTCTINEINDLGQFMSWDMGGEWYPRGFIPLKIAAERCRGEIILLS